MSNIRYTQKEKKEINDLYEKALDDLWDLWQTSTINEIRIRLAGEEQNNGKWYFYISDKQINLSTSAYMNHTIIYQLAAPQKKWGKTLLIKNKETTDAKKLFFLKQYEFIREKMLLRLEYAAKQKEGTKELFDNLKKKLNPESNVEIDFGNSTNLYPIEIVEEDGKTIGTINFGNQTIKIITEGDIVLIDKRNNKQKKKV